jgi:hypothetical protein
MTRVHIAGVVLLVLLAVVLLIRVTDRAGEPPKRHLASVPVEIPTVGSQPVIETVDLRNGNLHMEIPIRAARQKPTAPRSGH